MAKNEAHIEGPSCFFLSKNVRTYARGILLWAISSDFYIENEIVTLAHGRWYHNLANPYRNNR